MRKFAAGIIPGLIRPKALKEIRLLQEKGAAIVIVSASPENWIQPGPISLHQMDRHPPGDPGQHHHRQDPSPQLPWGRKMCQDPGKLFPSEYTDIYAYGDTSGDKPMLQLATMAFYKPFR